MHLPNEGSLAEASGLQPKSKLKKLVFLKKKATNTRRIMAVWWKTKTSLNH